MPPATIPPVKYINAPPCNYPTTVPGAHCQPGDPSYNTGDTHQGEMSKTVTLGCFGLDNCIQYNISAELGQDLPPEGFRFAQLEGPCAYLGHDFTAVSYLNLTSSQLGSDTPRGYECAMPVVVHTPDRSVS